MGASGANAERRPTLRPLRLTAEVRALLALATHEGWHAQKDRMIRRLSLGGASDKEIGDAAGLATAVVREILTRAPGGTG